MIKKEDLMIKIIKLQKEKQEIVSKIVNDINNLLSEGRPYNNMYELKEKWEKFLWELKE